MVKKTTQDLREMSKQSKYSCIRATLEKGYATKKLNFILIMYPSAQIGTARNARLSPRARYPTWSASSPTTTT